MSNFCNETNANCSNCVDIWSCLLDSESIFFLFFLHPGKMRTPMPGASANHGNTALFSWIAISPPWINRAGAKSKPWINPLCQTAWTSQLWCDGPLLSFLGEEAHEDEKTPTRNNQPESFRPRCGERISHMAASLKWKKEKEKSCDMTACGRFPLADASEEISACLHNEKRHIPVGRALSELPNQACVS